jgi:RND family efflux transporter MFP subunit
MRSSVQHTPLVLATLAVIATAAACRHRDAPATPPAAAVDAAVERVSAGVFPETFESGGVVRARTTATIASRVNGPVEAVFVSAGTRVRRGQPLIALESRELDANTARATAALAAAAEAARAADAEIAAADSAATLARATNDRIRLLFEKRSATAQEWDQASSGLRSADARAAAVRAQASAARAAQDAAGAALRAAETTRGYATIAAPFDGVVSERLVDPGTMVTAGTPLLVVEDPSALRLHVLVDEFRARVIAVGQPVEARLDRDGTWLAARVDEIGRVDPASHGFVVKLEMTPASGMRPGLFGRARFTAGERRAIAAPAASVVRRGQLAFVFVVTGPDRVARLRPVVVGEAAGDRLEVLAGLSEGDVVVVKPPAALSDGSRVTVRP